MALNGSERIQRREKERSDTPVKHETSEGKKWIFAGVALTFALFSARFTHLRRLDQDNVDHHSETDCVGLKSGLVCPGSKSKPIERGEEKVASPLSCSLSVFNGSDITTFLDPESVTFQYELVGCSIPDDGYLIIEQQKSEATSFSFSTGCTRTSVGCAGSITLSMLEVATHGVQLRFVPNPTLEGKLRDPPKQEFIFNVLSSRIPRSSPTRILAYDGLLPVKPSLAPNKLCKVGFAGGFTFDGQKTIWAALLRELVNQRERFTVEYFNFGSDYHLNGPFLQVLNDLGVSYFAQELKLMLKRREDIPAALERLIQSQNALLKTKRLVTAHRCKLKINHNSGRCSRWLMELIVLCIPDFGLDAVLHIIGHLEGIDVLIAGNSKLRTDSLLEIGARLAGVALTVFELTNTNPPENLNPVVFVGPSSFSIEVSSLEGFKLSKPVVIHPGIDMHHFPFNSMRWERKLGNEVTFGIIGRLDPDKLHGLFIDFAERISIKNPSTNFRFLIIGGGSLEDNLKRVVRLKNIPVEFTGFVPYSQLPEVMKELDFTVHLRYFETFCLVNIESMAMGIPVITFASAGVQEYFKHGVNGFLVPEPTVDSLVQTAETAMSLTTPATRFLASRSIQSFTVHRMVQSYLRLGLEWSGFLN